MERRTDGNHQFDALCHCSKRRRRGPCIQRWCFDALDVVEIELGDQRQTEPELFAALREPPYIGPAHFHIFVFDVAKPAAKNGEPVAISHRGTPLASTRSVRLAS